MKRLKGLFVAGCFYNVTVKKSNKFHSLLNSCVFLAMKKACPIALSEMPEFQCRHSVRLSEWAPCSWFLGSHWSTCFINSLTSVHIVKSKTIWPSPLMMLFFNHTLYLKFQSQPHAFLDERMIVHTLTASLSSVRPCWKAEVTAG